MKLLLVLLTALTLAACGRSGSSASAPLTETTLIQVDGMTCDNCVQGISGMLDQLPGVTEFQVNLDEASAMVSYDVKVLNPPQISDAISRLGFQTTVLIPSDGPAE